MESVLVYINFIKKYIFFTKFTFAVSVRLICRSSRKKSGIKPAIDALSGLKAPMNAWFASLFKAKAALSASAIANGQILRLRFCWEYTAAMTTHCTYKFPVNAFRVLNRVTFSTRDLTVKKCL